MEGCPFSVTVTVAWHSFSLKELMATEQELSMASSCNCTEMEAPDDSHSVISSIKSGTVASRVPWSSAR